MRYAAAPAGGHVGRFDFLGQYVAELPAWSTWTPSGAPSFRIGADPLGGASVAYWGEIADRYGLDLTVVNPSWTRRSGS